MSEYTAIFKCRLCGEVYKSGCTAGKEVAMNAAIGEKLERIAKAKTPVAFNSKIKL